MKKIWIGALVVCVICGGVWYANHRVKEAVASQVVGLLKQPQTQNDVSQYLQQYETRLHGDGKPKRAGRAKSDDSVAVQGKSSSVRTHITSNSQTVPDSSVGSSTESSSSFNKTTTSVSSSESSSTLTFANQQQVIQFAMSQFTEAEIVHFAKLYAERSRLSTAEKNQIKAQILSHFTPAQIAAMEAATQNS